MEILNNFGFEPIFFGAQIVNFLILAFVFKKFLYKPVLKLLKDRQKQIERGISDAEAAHVALEKASTERDDIIKSATIEAEKIIDETKKSAESTRDEIIAKAKADSEKIIAEAKQTAKDEFEKAINEAKIAAVDLSKNLLDRILSEMFNENEKEKIMARNIKRLEKYE